MRSNCSDISEHLKDNIGDYMATQTADMQDNFRAVLSHATSFKQNFKGTLKGKIIIWAALLNYSSATPQKLQLPKEAW